MQCYGTVYCDTCYTVKLHNVTCPGIIPWYACHCNVSFCIGDNCVVLPCIVLYCIWLSCIVLQLVMCCCVGLWHITLYHIILYNFMWCDVTCCCVFAWYAMPCYVMQYCLTLYHTALDGMMCCDLLLLCRPTHVQTVMWFRSLCQQLHYIVLCCMAGYGIACYPRTYSSEQYCDQLYRIAVYGIVRWSIVVYGRISCYKMICCVSLHHSELGDGTLWCGMLCYAI